jgi:glc operon protein GlcG
MRRTLRSVIGTRVAVAALFCAATASASAQLVDKPSLSLDGARRVIAGAVAEARRLNAPGGVIAVVDDGGNLMALERLDDTFAAGANISIGKARTAVLFKKPTKVFEDIIRNGRTSMVALEGFTPLQGGVPVVVDGKVVGGVGVSGASSAAQDEELAIAGAAALTGGAAPATAPVTYLEHEKVAAAFQKGMPLLEVENYKIHASRREKGSGQAEVHLKDTDVIHVLTGSATLVTGGTVVDGKTVAQDEVRGKAIAGGETRRITVGDVIVVPAGVPHWFQDVPAAMTYYVVKVAR